MSLESNIFLNANPFFPPKDSIMQQTRWYWHGRHTMERPPTFHQVNNINTVDPLSQNTSNPFQCPVFPLSIHSQYHSPTTANTINNK
jgi:hypothetical protein